MQFYGNLAWPPSQTSYLEQGEGMQTSICQPVERSEPMPQRISGLVLTHLDDERDEVFTAIPDPPCRLTRMRPVASAYESARGALLLSGSYNARFKAWPVMATLTPGCALGPGEGLPIWKAEEALRGFLAGEPEYVNLAHRLFEKGTGFSLKLGGDVRALIVQEDYFPYAIELGEPAHLTDPSGDDPC